MVDYFNWRAEDASRNGLTAFCHWGLRNFALILSEAAIRMSVPAKAGGLALRSDLGIEFHGQPNWMRLGSFLGWSDISHAGTKSHDGLCMDAKRNRLFWPDPAAVRDMIAELVHKSSWVD